jgi:CelD/BcsL family acetyltransferase involved in cellulose biosynthesis
VEWDAKDLLKQCGLQRWTFDHLVGTQRPLEPYHGNTDRSLFLDLSGGYLPYVSARRAAGTEQIKKVSALARQLEREAGTLRFQPREVNRDALRTLFRWKSEQYIRTGLIDAFRFRWIVRLFERLMESADGGFAGMLSTLSVEDRLIAVQFGLLSRGFWHYWIPAYDREFARFSPGHILLLKMAQAAPDLGVERITLGYDDADYKRRFASGSRPMAAGRVELSPSLTSLENRVERILRAAIVRLPIPARRRADERLDRLKIWWRFH